MNENSSMTSVAHLLVERLRAAMPKARWRMKVAGALGLGLMIAFPLGLLLMFHKGPWTGFFWDLLIRLPFALFCILMAVLLASALRARQLKDAGKLFLILAFFGALTSFACRSFVLRVSSLFHFHRLRPEQVHAVKVACHATDDPHSVQQIVQDLRGAQWYSPDSHGWEPYAPLAIMLADGRREEYSLARVLAENRLVVRLQGGNAVLLAVPHLRASMEAAGLLKVASYPRYDKKGSYQALDPASVCLSEQLGR